MKYLLNVKYAIKNYLTQDVYRDYFNQLFHHKWEDVVVNTEWDGYTTMQPVSWDYRFSNLCNFKCRTCAVLCLVVHGKQRLASKAT